MKISKIIAWTLLIAFLVMQFFRPEKNTDSGPYDRDFLAETNPGPEVRTILENTCYNCHSGNTNYPWYANVAPVSYWIAGHIDHGKRNLNISKWAAYEDRKKYHKLGEIVETIESSEMPLPSYTRAHEDARLTDEQRQAIIDWAERTRALYSIGERPR